jgi:RHS repeat-associated protein
VGNQLTQVDANTHKTTYTPDNMGRRRTRELPDGRTEHYIGYDATGNLTNKTDFANNGFTYGYTPLDDRLTSVSGPGIALTTGYDGFLRRYSMTDLSGQTTFNYDERDRMTKQTGPTGWGTLTFTYLYGGQVNTVASSNGNGNSLTYEYDHLNRPSAIQDGSNTTMITYDSIGNISQIILSNGVAVTYVYDNLNRLTAVKALLTSNSSFLTDFEYTLGPTGNRLSVTEVTGRAVTWTPDDLYRLTGENITVDPSGNTGDVAYTYDSVGNRNQRTSTVSPIVSQNFTGAYTTADLLKPTFDFDKNGNQLTNGNGVTYTYNALNQLTRVQGTSLDVAYVYDGDGLRVQKTSNGITTNYLWDRNNLTGYPQVSEELQSGNVVRRYVYGPKGPLYMVQLVGSTWVTSYFGEDATGSVRFLMNDSGQITDQYTRDAFGNLLSSSGAGTSNNIGFDGEFADSDTGLIYLRARWYDPTMGRFLSMDSYEGDQQNPLTLNKYEGFNENPINDFDPTGKAGQSANTIQCYTTLPLLLRCMPNTFVDTNGVVLLPRNDDSGKIQRVLMAECNKKYDKWDESMECILHVIFNRLHGGKKDFRNQTTLEQVLSAPGQFKYYPYPENMFDEDLRLANPMTDNIYYRYIKRAERYATEEWPTPMPIDMIFGNLEPYYFRSDRCLDYDQQLYFIKEVSRNYFYGYREDLP